MPQHFSCSTCSRGIALFGNLAGASIGPDLHPLAGEPVGVRWATSLALLPLALRLLLLPYALNHHYRFGTLEIPEGFLDWRALVGLLLLGLLLGFAAWGMKRRESAPALALALFLLPLGPSLHVISVVGVLFAERFLYIPVAGLALLFGWVLERGVTSPGLKRVAAPALALLLVICAVLTFDRVRAWGSAERLARASVAAYPNGAGAWKQLGLALVRDGRADEATEPLEQATRLNPRDGQAWLVYARALRGAGRYAESAAALREVVALAPQEPGIILREIGQVELLAGNPDGAIASLQRAHELMPADAVTLHALATAYLRSDRAGEAVRVLREGRQAMQTDPPRRWARCSRKP